MKKMLLFVFLASLIFNCEFPLDKKNFVTVSPTPTTNVKINLINLPDTVMVIDDLTIEYELDVKNTPAGGIFASIGNEVGYVGQAFKGSFVIPNVNDQIVGKGYLPFEFFVIATTGTGSLADHSYRETKIFSVKKTLYFDYSPAASVNVKEIAPKNGILNISWDKYPYRNLKSLMIRRTFNGGATQDLIVNPKSTSYADVDFIGSDVTYQIIATNNLGSSEIGPVAKYVSNYNPRIIEFKDSGYDIRLTWNKVPCTGSTGSYTIVDDGGMTLFSTTNLSDTTTLIKLPLGSPRELKLVVQSRTYALTTRKFVWLGKKIPKFSSVIYDQAQDRFFYLSPPYLIKDELGKRDSSTFDFDLTRDPFLSQDGNAIYLSKNAADIYEISTSDFSLLKSYNLPNINPFVVLGDHFIGNGGGRMLIIDKATSTIVQDYLGSYGSPGLTTNSQYIISEEPGTPGNVWLHNLDQNGLIINSKSTTGSVGVLGNNHQNLYVISSNFYANVTSMQSFTFPDFDFVSGSDKVIGSFYSPIIDKSKELLMSANFSGAYIVDLETFQTTTIALTYYPTALTGGVLFVMMPDSSEAFALKVK